MTTRIGVKPTQADDRILSKRSGFISTMGVSKCIVFLALLSPMLWLVYSLVNNNLGANPIEAITNFTGEWAMRILLLSLAMTPIRMLVKRTWPIKFRRMVGLFAFFYVVAHLLTYLVLDQQFDWRAIFLDVLDRPYITAGTVAFLILLPMAVTSTKAIARKMGKRWFTLHRLVYIAAIAAVLHYIWLARGDLVEPFVYLLVLLALLLFRIKKLLS